MKSNEKLELIMDFLNWIKNSDSGYDICHIHEVGKPALKRKEKLVALNMFFNSPEIDYELE
jgi:hypothetical protein